VVGLCKKKSFFLTLKVRNFVVSHFCLIFALGMEEQTFNALLPLKIAGILKYVMERGYDRETAIGKLYGSKLYESVCSEQTKMWWYSSSLLADLLIEEVETGKFTYPDN